MGIVAFVSVAAACGQSPTEVAGTCVAVVNVDGVFLTTDGGVVPADSVGESYLTIARNTGCLDQGEPADPLAPGESNFLEVGTALHRVPGFGPTERLTYRIDTGEWLVLAGLAGYADLTLAVGEEVTVPGTMLRVGLAGIVSDSRCPVDVTCVWAGDAEIEIGLAMGTGPTSAHRLHVNTQVGPWFVDYQGYRIRLVHLAPEPRESIDIDEGDYRVRLVVEALEQG